VEDLVTQLTRAAPRQLGARASQQDGLCYLKFFDRRYQWASVNIWRKNMSARTLRLLAPLWRDDIGKLWVYRTDPTTAHAKFGTRVNTCVAFPLRNTPLLNPCPQRTPLSLVVHFVLPLTSLMNTRMPRLYVAPYLSCIAKIHDLPVRSPLTCPSHPIGRWARRSHC
jgi:hypothetical protein